MKSRVATDDQRDQMRGCRQSACETAEDLTPIYLCDKPRKGKHRKGGSVCVLYDVAHCKDYDTFPERFNT